MGEEKLIAVAGYGPGISAAVARKFGRQGFKVALISRTKAKLEAAASGKMTSYRWAALQENGNSPILVAKSNCH